jgi:chemotaxis response regulator CheB
MGAAVMAQRAPERPEPANPNFDVVAIAASAGGIHAISRIIWRPAFRLSGSPVVVQHLVEVSG